MSSRVASKLSRVIGERHVGCWAPWALPRESFSLT